MAWTADEGDRPVSRRASVSTTCTGRRSAAASRWPGRSRGAGRRPRRDAARPRADRRGTDAVSGSGSICRLRGSSRSTDDVDATPGQRRVRPLRERHLPEHGREPSANRLVLRALPGTVPTRTDRRAAPHVGRRGSAPCERRRRRRPGSDRRWPGSTGRSCHRLPSRPTSASSPTRRSPPSGVTAAGVVPEVVLPAGAAEVATGPKAAADPQHRTVLRPPLRPLEEAGRADRGVHPLVARRSGGWPSSGVRRGEPRLRAGGQATGGRSADRRARQRARGAQCADCSPRRRCTGTPAASARIPQRHPERFEHFGITVVEAMAAGAVPLVFGAGGPAEIVGTASTASTGDTLDELVEVSQELTVDTQRRRAGQPGAPTGGRVQRRAIRCADPCAAADPISYTKS